MLSFLSLSQRVKTETLESLAISATVRWMLAFGGCIFLSFLVIGLPNEAYPDWKIFKDPTHILGGGLLVFLLFVIWDTFFIRRHLVNWDNERLHDIRIMGRLPLLLIFLVPLYYFLDQGGSLAENITWAADMLWVFSCLSVVFYITYLLLLLTVPRLPRLPALIGLTISISASIWGYKSKSKRESKIHEQIRSMNHTEEVFLPGESCGLNLNHEIASIDSRGKLDTTPDHIGQDR